MNRYRVAQRERTERAAREAAEWLQVLHADRDAAAQAAFIAWVRASPLHVRELLVATALEKELAAPGAFAGLDVEALVAHARDDGNVVPLAAARQPEHAAGRRGRPRARRKRLAWAAMLAGVALMGASAGWLALHPAPVTAEYTTTVGNEHVIEMPDGSIVTLGPRAQISATFSRRHRNVTLDYGEARFKVVHDAARPFRVYAGASVIQDVGTEFTVNRLPSGTVVNVMEGKVKVMSDRTAALHDGVDAWVRTWLPADAAAIRGPGKAVVPVGRARDLVAGQSAHIAMNGRELVLGKAPATQDRSAFEGRLTFHDTTLADIVAEFNRYNATPIVVDGKAARMRRYSGVFDADDPASFLQFLTCCSDLTVAQEHGRTVVGLAHAGTHAQ